MKESICSLFISGRWNELNRCAFLTVKNHNPDKLIEQHLPVKEKINNPFGNNRSEESIRMRKSLLTDSLNIVGILEIVECGGIILEIVEGFFCDDLDYKLFRDFV